MGDESLEVESPRRCLHVVESLDRGAVENWLLRMLRHARATGTPVDWTFYTLLDLKGALEATARELGANVIHSPAPMREPLNFMRALRAELIRGKYDVLHGHHDLLNSLYLLASVGTPVTTRVAHVHNADESIPTQSPLKRFAYREPMRQVCIRLADRIVGISQHTLDTFLRGRTRRAGKDIVHYYGVDPEPFLETTVDRTSFRHSLEISNDETIVLFAGRIVPEKNPLFAVDVLAALQRLRRDVVGVFAGAGSEEGRVAKRVKDLGIEKRVRFLGWRSDLPTVMMHSDLFILPHPSHPVEGFGLAVVEAQLAGLRLLISDGVADDPLLPSAAFRRVPLSAGPERWASVAAELIGTPQPRLEDARNELRESPMDLDRALTDLLAIHNLPPD